MTEIFSQQLVRRFYTPGIADRQHKGSQQLADIFKISNIFTQPNNLPTYFMAKTRG